MNYVFLDVDGVLNSDEYFERRERTAKEHRKEGFLRREDDLDPVACTLANGIITRCNLQVVLSSTWRSHGLELVGPMFVDKGLTAPLIGKTPHIGPVEAGSNYKRSETQRGLEIEWWLVENVLRSEWADTRIVILDDDSDMSRLMPWFVHTPWPDGLQPKHEALIAAVLERPLGALLETPNPLWTPEALKYLGY